jgi:hypothetical protein
MGNAESTTAAAGGPPSSTAAAVPPPPAWLSALQPLADAQARTRADAAWSQGILGNAAITAALGRPVTPPTQPTLAALVADLGAPGGLVACAHACVCLLTYGWSCATAAGVGRGT